MNIFLYKIITAALAVALLSTFILAVGYFSLLGDRPKLSDDARFAYELQVCDLQEKLNHPTCIADGEIIHFNDIPSEGGFRYGAP